MRVFGVPQALARLATLGTSLGRASEQAGMSIAEQVAADMRARVAVDTGETRDSIQATAAGVEAGGAWLFLEFGTVNMAAQPFIRPAADTASVTPAEAVLKRAIVGVL